MSYEIVYSRQFVRIDDKIIPLALHGSNNCTEISPRGRERRERHWDAMYIGRNKNIAHSEQSIMDKISTYCDGSCSEHFMKSGKWVDDNGLLRFFQRGCKEAKTVEEIQEAYYCSGLHGYFSVWNHMDHKLENEKEIRSSDDLREYLKEAEQRLSTKNPEETIYIGLTYFCDTLAPREKERLGDYYTIKVNDTWYFEKRARGRIKCTFYINQSKQFKSEKEAHKYMEKLHEDFRNHSFSVEHIIV